MYFSSLGAKARILVLFLTVFNSRMEISCSFVALQILLVPLLTAQIHRRDKCSPLPVCSSLMAQQYKLL